MHPARRTLVVILAFTLANHLVAQETNDSVISLSDLRFHSLFEESSINNFILHNNDTFDLFLSIDRTIKATDARELKDDYESVYPELEKRKIRDKNLNAKVKIVYSVVHDHFLKKYNSNEYFPVMIRTGTYNCVSASMLFSLVFDYLEIPYKIMASVNHVYLIANPGAKSIVVETTNPEFEKAIFNGDFKQNYVNYLRSSKLISEDEYRNKSVEEIFEAKFNEVREVEFNNLIGIQYYNKAVTALQENDRSDLLALAQKAYFFFPDDNVKGLMYLALLLEIEKSRFEKISDIDYLAQLARFGNTEPETVSEIFGNIISYWTQFTDSEEHCDSLHKRFISGIRDKALADEVSFNYYMKMSYRFQTPENLDKYVSKALDIKSNHLGANMLMENLIRRKLNMIEDPVVLLDSVRVMEERYRYSGIHSLLNDYRGIGYLRMAENYCEKGLIKQGEEYLVRFEAEFPPPAKTELLDYWIERAYRAFAVHFYYKKDKNKVRLYLDRGFKYVPDSRSLKSVTV